MAKEKVYCRYHGEHSQRNLERSRLNQSMRGGEGGGEEMEKKREREEDRKREEPGAKRPRDHVAKVVVLHSEKMLGEEVKLRGWKG